MTKEEKAKEYALNACKEEISKLEQAYLDGYNDALQEQNRLHVEEDGVKYYDMSLPSGTMWSEYLRDCKGLIELPYNQVKDLDIPTYEEFLELKEYTRDFFDKNVNCSTHVSVDGIELNLLKNKFFWVKTDDSNSQEAKIVSSAFQETKSFKGASRCVILVKRKK